MKKRSMLLASSTVYRQVVPRDSGYLLRRGGTASDRAGCDKPVPPCWIGPSPSRRKHPIYGHEPARQILPCVISYMYGNSVFGGAGIFNSSGCKTGRFALMGCGTACSDDAGATLTIACDHCSSPQARRLWALSVRYRSCAGTLTVYGSSWRCGAVSAVRAD